MPFELYAQRLLNPFRGAVHSVRYGAAEAVTADGTHWDIYVANDELLRGMEGGRRVQVGEIRYGRWSAAEGLRRGRWSPSDDFRRMEALGTELFEYLPAAHRQLPFPFQDRYELWLLDGALRPLALLHSVLQAKDMDDDLSLEWRAGLAAREHFSSAAMAALAGPDTPMPSAGDHLTRYINDRAGTSPAAQWFWRAPDGRGLGQGGIGLAPAQAARVLDPGAFPPLFLSACDHSPAHQQLVEDYLAWQAPCLLLWPGLDRPTRAALEQQARRQAFTVERQFRLYPEIIDADAIQAARVEAVMRRSQAPAPNEEETLSTFYIELSPSADA
jgi:hypothetical protein